ncbi:DinB family protein [Kiloniella antarctica]|uniref:DinB family protein n=1 Tax=Kiloniella antarctica TaxID=1550907 RepID=A0ABW5BNK2_9PROT
MTPKEIIHLSHYNAWANETLYLACSQLSETEYKLERKSYFGSIHNTLNHILVGDRIWFGRLENVLENLGLGDILYDDFNNLSSARTIEDQRIISFAEKITQARLDGVLDYKNVAGDFYSDPMDIIIRHIFNHQTHHRGQVHCLLSQTDVPPPSLDIMYYMRAND